ncbi:hypothetical protein CP973_17730 [Streptomyces albofaciens JCM 4342]|uniref:hypothetical protein n=1 Tax=Streptomyces albofaciens TaxID=66866 RepID=UPI001239CD59|nr:hypothetical protein [Streptomyces albofaciens]KAA6223521.1 hypothetical protein CP973_17730 [Streptomyces albofaciens JCM 4342]
MSGRTGTVRGGVDGMDGPARHRSRIHELDRDIARLIRLRTAEDRRLQDARRAAGRPRTDLAWENAVLRGYQEALGPAGAQLALILLALGRSTSPGPAVEPEERKKEPEERKKEHTST